MKHEMAKKHMEKSMHHAEKAKHHAEKASEAMVHQRSEKDVMPKEKKEGKREIHKQEEKYRSMKK